MAATVVTDFTFTNTAESVTNWYAYKISGTGGDPSAALETDVYIQGTYSISATVNKQRVWLYLDAYTDNGSVALDFSTSGAEENSYLYIWFNFLTPGFSQVQSGGGITVAIGTDTNNYFEYYIDGIDTYEGGWKRAVLHPNSLTASDTTGTPNLNDIRFVGIVGDVQGNTARFTNLYVDRIDVGTKLRVYGDSSTKVGGDNTTGTWADILLADEGTGVNKYGVVRSDNDIIYVNGGIELGDGLGTNAATLDDEDRIVVWENPTYYNGTSVVSTVDASWAQLSIQGNATGANAITHGNIVGSGDTASGSNGCTFQSAGPQLTVDLSDNTHANSVNETYGCKFFKAAGGITLSDTDASDHEFIGNIVDQSGQVNTNANVVIRGCTFSGTTDNSSDGSALLWNPSINIKNSSFNANADATNDPHGVEHPAIGTFTYDNLQFSGNDYDIENSSSGLVTINATNNANPSTFENTGGGTTVILNPKTLKVEVLDSGGTAIEGTQVWIQKQSNDTDYGHPGKPFTSAAGNTQGDGDFVVTTGQTVPGDLPTSGWLIVQDVSTGEPHSYRYASRSGQTFSFKTKVGPYACSGGGTSTSLQDTVRNFVTMENNGDIAEGDTIRNEDDGGWAILLEVVDADNITTTALQGGSLNIWTSGDNYSMHTLAVNYVDATDSATVPLMNEEANASGIATEDYNYGGDKNVTVRIRLSSGGTTDYLPYSSNQVLTGTTTYSLDLLVSVAEDIIKA